MEGEVQASRRLRALEQGASRRPRRAAVVIPS